MGELDKVLLGNGFSNRQESPLQTSIPGFRLCALKGSSHNTEVLVRLLWEFLVKYPQTSESQLLKGSMHAALHLEETIKIFFHFLDQPDCDNTKLLWKHFHCHFLLEKTACFVCFHKPSLFILDISTCLGFFFLTGNHPITTFLNSPHSQCSQYSGEDKKVSNCFITSPCNTAPLRDSRRIFLEFSLLYQHKMGNRNYVYFHQKRK